MSKQQFVQCCIMGGCEYLPSIQQVGLKVAIRLFAKHKTLEAVIASLKSNKAFKERVPELYLEAVQRVEALFFYQTVYDPVSEALLALEEIPAGVLETIEAEFLGGKAPLDGVLAEYVQGRLDKKSMKPRARYASVLDLKRLKDDIRMNCVNDRTFHCIDKTFFLEGFALSDRKKPGVRLAEEEKVGKANLSKTPDEEEKRAHTLPSVISKKPGKQVEDDDFGFCFSESEDEGEGPKTAGADAVELKINLDNKYVKEDIAILSSLCSDILS